MERPAVNPSTVQFGLFEVDLRARELRKSGIKIKLNEQPFQVLTLLLERPGEIVTREELQARLWSADTFVDFDLSLNSAVKKLRQALGDESDNPRFVETLYRRGYRFIAPVSAAGRGRELPAVDANVPAAVSPVSQTAQDAGLGAGSQLTDSGRSGENAARSRKRLAFLATGCLAVLLVGIVLELNPKSSPRVTGFTQITSGGKVHQLSALVTDGQRLYFHAVDKDRIAVGVVSVFGGESAFIATPFQNTIIGDVAPDGSSILTGSVDTSNEDTPVWLFPLPAGPARLSGITRAHSAVWTLDGRRLVYSNGGERGELYETNLDGSDARKLATLNAHVSDVRLSPDGQRIRVTLDYLKTAASELWELNRDGSHAHPLLPNWSDSPHECCGRWTPDGSYFLFTSFRGGRNSLWALPGKQSWIRGNDKPVQLTNGPVDFWLPVPSRDGKHIFAMGGLPRSEVLRYDGIAFVPYLGGASAADLAFSADGQRVAYVSVPELTLWASKIDGSDRIQLSDPRAMEVALPRWSPDGRQIVFMARTSKTDWRAYLVSADGQDLKELIPGATVGIDPNWAPDGKSIVFSANDLGPVSNNISILDLQTGKLTPLPGAEKVFSPRWSPDGRYIAAVTTDSAVLMLFDRKTQQWTDLARMGIGYPSWSHDGQYLYFDSTLTEDPAFFRVRISDHRLERLASLKDIHRFWGPNAEWSGLGPDDSLLVTRNISSPEIYALDWQP